MRIATLFLQLAVVFIGIGALALLLWEPQIEGRNAHATFFQIYFNDPFLAYAYIASISFFTVLYQTFKLLGYARQNKMFSQVSVKAVRTIKLCAMTIIGFVAGGEAFILLADSDDRAGGVFMGGLIAFGATVIAAAAVMFEGLLRHAMDTIKKRHEGASDSP